MSNNPKPTLGSVWLYNDSQHVVIVKEDDGYIGRWFTDDGKQLEQEAHGHHDDVGDALKGHHQDDEWKFLSLNYRVYFSLDTKLVSSAEAWQAIMDVCGGN